MRVYRLSRSKYARDLSGKGAEKTGGRWNSKGTPVVYTCFSIALCTVELAVHLPMGIVPGDYCLTTIEIPDDTDILEIGFSSLPVDWKALPPPASTQQFGDAFVAEREYLAMKVPSAVVQHEFNCLLNPAHPAFSKVKIGAVEGFTFDERLF